jgi:hypothetical protein
MLPGFKIYSKATVIKTSVVLLYRQRYMPVEQNKEPRNKFIHLCLLDFQQRIQNRERTVSSINGVVKTELHMQKNVVYKSLYTHTHN